MITIRQGLSSSYGFQVSVTKSAQFLSPQANAIPLTRKFAVPAQDIEPTSPKLQVLRGRCPVRNVSDENRRDRRTLQKRLPDILLQGKTKVISSGESVIQYEVENTGRLSPHSP